MNSALIEPAMDSGLSSLKEFSLIDRENFPEHIAIIMDGNRRWAKNQYFPAIVGHRKGAETLTKIVRASAELGVKVLTVFAFSTENWCRSQREVAALMRLLKSYLLNQQKIMIEEEVRLQFIGDISRLPKDVCDVLDETIKATSTGNRLDLVIALNYGGRDDIRRAMQAILNDCLLKKISKEDLSEKLISKYLDTHKWKDPDLLIRTSGEYRISNFLLWQISYSEVFVTDVLWPDFSERDLLKAILSYQKRELRLGK